MNKNGGNEKQDQSHLCASIPNLDNLVEKDQPSIHDVADQSSGTDNDIEHVEERLQEILMSNAKIRPDDVITPIEELVVDDVVDHIILDSLNEKDPIKVQNRETTTVVSSNENGKENPLKSQNQDMPESEVETQLDKDTVQDAVVDSRKRKLRNSQELYNKVAAAVLDSYREIQGQENGYLIDSSDVDASAVEAHELLPLNTGHGKQSSGKEATASLVLKTASPEIRKRKTNSIRHSDATKSSNKMSRPPVSVRSKPMQDCSDGSIISKNTMARKRTIVTAKRCRKNPNPNRKFKFRILPNAAFPEITDGKL